MREKIIRVTILILFLSIAGVFVTQNLVHAGFRRGGRNSIHYSIEQVCTNGIAFRLAGDANAPNLIGIRAEPEGEYWENHFGGNFWQKTFTLQNEEIFIPGVGTLPKSGFFTSDWGTHTLQPGNRVELFGTTNGGFIGAYVTVENCTLPDPLPTTLADLGYLPEKSLFGNETPMSVPPITNGGNVSCRPGIDAISATLSIPQDLIIADINVTMYIEHEGPETLKATLTSPQGTTVTLFDQVDGPGDSDSGDYNFGKYCIGTRGPDDNPTSITEEKPDFILDTESAFQFTSSHAAPPYDTTAFMPTGPGSLSDFYGENAAGEWTLNICDVEPTTSGSLECWFLEIEAEPNVTYLPIVIK